MKSLRKPDTLTNIVRGHIVGSNLKTGRKLGETLSFFFTIKIVAESYLQNELMTEYLRKKIKYDKL